MEEIDITQPYEARALRGEHYTHDLSKYSNPEKKGVLLTFYRVGN